MWDIWANLLLPKAFKSCPKSKKSPKLVTLHPTDFYCGHKCSGTLTPANIMQISKMTITESNQAKKWHTYSLPVKQLFN